jgi:hypothetical protein
MGAVKFAATATITSAAWVGAAIIRTASQPASIRFIAFSAIQK